MAIGGPPSGTEQAAVPADLAPSVEELLVEQAWSQPTLRDYELALAESDEAFEALLQRHGESLVVDFAIEDLATEVLAANLATLSPPQLDSLAVALQTLPATPSVADCKQFEGRFHGESQLSELYLTSFAKAGVRGEQIRMRKLLL